MSSAFAASNTPVPARRSSTYRIVRQVHLWIGAWGAIAAILYGSTGLVLNHRGSWPQGQTSDAGRETVMIPVEARESPEQLSLWLRQTRQLDATTIRKGGPGNGPGAGRGDGGADRAGAPRWSLSGGSGRHPWSLDYTPGSDSAELKHSERSALAVLNSLHKTFGGGWAWSILADSFAVAMVLLGVSGIVLWARGRSARQMVLSVFGVALAILLWVLVPAFI